MRKLISFLALTVIVSACSPQSGISAAENSMRTFFAALVEQDYQTAVSLYDGSYAELSQMNPDISPTNYVALWQHGCEQNGFVCMEVLDNVRAEEKGSQVEFGVTFKTKDGKKFEFTGCCGETLPNSITEYVIVVKADAEGNYKVQSLPPYVP